MKKNYYIFIQMFLFVSLTCFQVNAQQIKPERNKTEKVGHTGSNKIPGTADTGNYVGYSTLFQQL